MEVDQPAQKGPGLPWVEKYRPSKLDDLISHAEIIGTIQKFIDSSQLPHLERMIIFLMSFYLAKHLLLLTLMCLNDIIFNQNFLLIKIQQKVLRCLFRFWLENYSR